MASMTVTCLLGWWGVFVYVLYLATAIIVHVNVGKITTKVMLSS